MWLLRKLHSRVSHTDIMQLMTDEIRCVTAENGLLFGEAMHKLWRSRTCVQPESFVQIYALVSACRARKCRQGLLMQG